MEYALEKKVVDITLRLSTDEFNTIVASFGASTYSDAASTAKFNGLRIVEESDSNKLYTELKRIALENN